MSTLQDLLDVSLQFRSAEEQNLIIRRGKLGTSLEKFDVGEENAKQKRFLALMLAQYDWLVFQEPNMFFCWSCVLMPNGQDSWNQDGVLASEVTSEVIFTHEISDFHKQSHAWVEKKRKKLAERTSSSSSNTKIVCEKGNEKDNDNNTEDNEDRRIVKAHLYHLSRFIKPSLIYLNEPKIGLLPFYRSWLMAFPQFKLPYSNRTGVLKNRFKLNVILNQSIHEVMREEIRTEIEPVSYVSLVIEDIGTIYRCFMAIFIRMIHPTTGQLTDRLVDFFDEDHHRRMEPLLEHVHKVVQEFHLADKLIAVTCSGVAVDNSKMTEFFQAIKKAYPRVMVTDGTKISRQLVARLFHAQFPIGFFASQLLHMDSCVAEMRRSVAVQTNTTVEKLKAMNLSGLCTFLHTERLAMIRFLQYLYNFSEGDRKDPILCWHYLGDFTSIFLTPFFAYLLKRLETVEDRVRKQFPDWQACLATIDNLELDLKKFKEDNFEIFYREAMRKAPRASSVEVVSDIPKEEYHWSTRDFNFQDPQVKEEFGKMLNQVIELTLELARKFRFDSWQQLQFFNLVNTSQFDRYVTKFPNEYIESLENSYPEEFDSEKLREELLYLYTESRVKSPTVEQFLQYFNRDKLGTTFPETSKLVKLIQTIPCRIFAGASQPRVTSRQNLLDQFHVSFIFLQMKREYYFRCEWRLFKELCDSPRFYQKVVTRFFELYETGQSEHCEMDLFDFVAANDQDQDDDDGEDDDEGEIDDDTLLACYLEEVKELDKENFPFRNKMHFMKYQYDIDFDQFDIDFDDDYLVIFGLKSRAFQPDDVDFDEDDEEDEDSDSETDDDNDHDDNDEIISFQREEKEVE